MSKAAKKILGIVVVLLVLVLAYAGITTMDKQKLEQINTGLQADLRDSEGRVAQGLSEIQNLKGVVDKTKAEVKKVQTELTSAKKKSTDLGKKIKSAERDRDKYKKRIDDVRKERDDLMGAVKDLKKDKSVLEDKLAEAKAMAEMVVKEEPVKPKTTATRSTSTKTPTRQTTTPKASSRSTLANQSNSVNEAYWAQLLQDKAGLEIQIQELEDKIAKSTIEIVDLAQSKTELQIELDELQHEHEAVKRDMAHQEGLINNLSLELARAKNDKKFISDRTKKVTSENKELRSKLKMLSSTKGALEKSIVRLSQDKQKIEGELGKSETIIQSKIDEIWEIKDSIDQTLKSTKTSAGSSDVELPPIIVSSDGTSKNFNAGVTHPGLNGKVVSVNHDNNFLIINVGQNSGVSVGDQLSVYRDGKYLASLDVIQVRNDIAAADIKDQWTKIEVGDLVQ